MTLKPDDFRRQVGRYKERWYTDPLPGSGKFKATKDIWPSVSTIKGAYPKFLTYWAGNTVAEWAFDNQAAWRNLKRDEAIPLMAGAHERDRNRGGERGTGLHIVAEKLINGESLDPLEALEIQPLIIHLRRFLADWRPEPILTEFPIIHRGKGLASGYGGTGDLIARMPTRDNGVFLIDLKSRKPGKETEVYDDEGIQTVAYADADYYFDLATGERKELPQVVGCLIVAVSATGYHVHPVIMDAARAQWAATVALWKARLNPTFEERWLNPVPTVVDGLDPFTGLTAAEQTKAKGKRATYTCAKCGNEATSTFMEREGDAWVCKAQRACEKRQKARDLEYEAEYRETYVGEPYEVEPITTSTLTAHHFDPDELYEVTTEPRPTLTVVRDVFGPDTAEVYEDEARSMREWLVASIHFYQDLMLAKGEHEDEARQVLLEVAAGWPVRSDGKPVPTFTEGDDQTLDELRAIDAAMSAALDRVKPAFGPTRPDTTTIDAAPAVDLKPYTPPAPGTPDPDDSRLNETEYKEVQDFLADLEQGNPSGYAWLNAMAVKCHVAGYAITITQMPFWRRANILIALGQWADKIGTTEATDETLRIVVSTIVGATVAGDRLPAALGALTISQSNALMDWANQATQA